MNCYRPWLTCLATVVTATMVVSCQRDREEKIMEQRPRQKVSWDDLDLGNFWKSRDRRNEGGLIDDLNGVWVYVSDQPGETTLTVINNMRYKDFRYHPNRIDPVEDLRRQGPVWGQEGVYFLPNEASYYSPSFYVEVMENKLFILNKFDYDKHIRTNGLPAIITVWVAEELDFSTPPRRPSFAELGLGKPAWGILNSDD